IFSCEEFKVSYANKSYRNLLNNRKIIGEKITELIPEVAEQGFLANMREVRKSGKPFSDKEVAASIDYRGDGSVTTRYFNYTYRSVMEPDEKVPSIVLHAVDITPLVEKSVAMEEEQLFLRLISQTLPEHILVLQPDRSIEFINNSGLKYYGLKQIKSLRTIMNRIHEEDKETVVAKMDLVFNDFSPQDMECRIKNAKGDYNWHIFKARTVLDERDRFFKVILSATDINHQKVVQKNKDDFMGVASHELKTPLTTVKAYTQLLHDHLEGSGDDTALTYLERTDNSVEKLEKFVSDLLDISRIQRGKLTLEKSKVSIKEMIKSVSENLQITNIHHRLVLDLTEEKIILNIDRDRIEQVLVNLVNNAAKYSSEGNEIHVGLKKKAEQVIVSVKDFGVGIDASDLENVFDRFFRVKEHQENVSGLGIGLNISKEIIELHGGEIWVESKLKQGSVFRFSLPINN
ncbi:MAG: ATP-binding protein, partial [Cyclobacteriaceae bacterium]